MRKLFLMVFGIVALTAMVFSMPVNALAQEVGNDVIVGQHLDDPPGDANGRRGADDPPGDDRGGDRGDDRPCDDNPDDFPDDSPGHDIPCDDIGGGTTDDPPGDDSGGDRGDDRPCDDNPDDFPDDSPGHDIPCDDSSGDDSSSDGSRKNGKSKKPRVKSGKLKTNGKCRRENSFRTDEDVYVKKAKRLPAGATVDIYVVENKDWNVDSVIGPFVIKTTATVDDRGKISCVEIWTNPLETGEYDIVIDAGGTIGEFDRGIDAVDGRGAKPGFRVR